MKTLTISSLLVAVMALPAVAHADLLPSPKVEATAEVSAEVSDDILMIIDLPIAALSAREAGIEEAEIAETIEGAEEIGLSASDTTIALGTEAQEVKTRGKKRGFGVFVKTLLIEGYRGEELAAKIKERKEELAEMSPEAKAELKAKLKTDLQAKREEEKARRKTLGEKLKAEKDKGAKIKHRHSELHATLDAKRKEAREEHIAKKATIKAAIAEEKGKDNPDPEKLNALRKDLRGERVDTRKDKAKIDKRKDKLEAVTDKRTDKHEKREGNLEEKIEAKKDKKEKRADKKEKIQAKQAKRADKKAKLDVAAAE